MDTVIEFLFGWLFSSSSSSGGLFGGTSLVSLSGDAAGGTSSMSSLSPPAAGSGAAAPGTSVSMDIQMAAPSGVAPGTAGREAHSGFLEGMSISTPYGQTYHGPPVGVPEIDAASGLLAISAVLAALALVYERKRHNPGK